MRRCSLGLLSALVLLPPEAVAQTARRASAPERARAATDRLVRAYMRDQHVPGVSVAVVANGRIAYARGYGWANLEDSVPVTPRTRFPSASTAKLLTATAILQLTRQGTLALGDSIETRCPAYPRKRWPVTIGRLLVHQGGIRPSTGAD